MLLSMSVTAFAADTKGAPSQTLPSWLPDDAPAPDPNSEISIVHFYINEDGETIVYDPETEVIPYSTAYGDAGTAAIYWVNRSQIYWGITSYTKGLMTFAGDVLKCFAAVLIVRGLYHGSNCLALLMMYAGAGVTLGHNFPFYMKFKGGKGIAVMAALTVSNCFWHLPYSVLMFFITLAFFAVPVAVTRYISLGSLLAYAAFFIEMVVFGQFGWFGMEQAYLYELYILVFLLTALAWWRHRANIRRLLNGTENKFGSGKSKSKEG